MERELTIITTRSLLGATASLTPCNHFVALLICDATTMGTQEIADFARSLIESGCSYFCCWGPDCERVHDIFDEEFVNDGTNTETIMTTWHASETLEEFASFALLNTEPTQSFRATTNSTVAIVIDDYISASRIKAALVATPGTLWLITRDNNVMHATPDLRVFLKGMIAGSGSVITAVMQLGVYSRADGMPLTDEQLARIEFLLYECEDDATFAETLLHIDSSAELHALAQQINWDCGFDALEAVLEHPLCDRGTALMIYWLGEPTCFADLASDEDVPDVNRSLKEFLNRVQNQLMSEQFKSNTICFDPMVEMNVVQRRKIENAGTIPAVLKKPNC